MKLIQTYLTSSLKITDRSDQDWYTLPSILNETDYTSWPYKKWHIVLSVTGCT